MIEFESNGAIIVSWDFTNGEDNDLVLVGKKVPKKPTGYSLEIINAFQGADARAVYEMLTKKKEKSNGN